MTDTRTPDQIEQDLARDRARLSASINDLQDRFSAEGLVGEISDALRDQGGELMRGVAGVVRRNPAAAILTGAGLLWLTVGRSHAPAGAAGRAPAARNWDERPLPRHRERYATPRHASDPAWLDDAWEGEDRYGTATSQSAAGDYSKGDAAPGTGGAAQASGLASQIAEGAGAMADSAQRGYAAGHRKVSETGARALDRAAKLRDRLSEGTEGLTTEARDRIVKAREAAYEARRQVMGAAHDGRVRAEGFYRDQPLVAGALAVAAGAAIAGALPRSRWENEHLGAQSDALAAEAQRIFQEEKEKAAAVLKSTAGEAEAQLRAAGAELKASVDTDRMRDAAETAAQKVAETARESARSEGLGRT
ncbi:DUF3618 domain-containing protein [Frigidibacter sp. MR17.24]|uniref:DUF3618 domain-containing protein n=1 Tax=Frigidibacter sp. MR17.24 TaxID=3127345 RepID=UPI00301304C4